LTRADLKPILEQDNTGVDHGLLDVRGNGEKAFGFVFCAKAHNALDSGTIVPAAVEDHDLSAGRQVGQIALNVHLGFFAIGWGGEGDHPEYPWTYPLRDRLDDAALARTLSTFKDDADLLSPVPDPFFKINQLAVHLSQSALVILALEPVLTLFAANMGRRLRRAHSARTRGHAVPSCWRSESDIATCTTPPSRVLCIGNPQLWKTLSIARFSGRTSASSSSSPAARAIRERWRIRALPIPCPWYASITAKATSARPGCVRM